jgi:glucan phosphoethanolaminetransferase (alkaline phosphatase superfamily)
MSIKNSLFKANKLMLVPVLLVLTQFLTGVSAFAQSSASTSSSSLAGSGLINTAQDQMYGYIKLFINLCVGACVIALIGLLVSIAINVFRKETQTLSGQIIAFVIIFVVASLLIVIGSNPRIFG